MELMSLPLRIKFLMECYDQLIWIPVSGGKEIMGIYAMNGTAQP